MNKRASLLLVLLAAFAGACTTDAREPSPTLPPPPTTTTTVPVTTTTTIPVEEATVAFHGCLAENGVEIDEIPFDSRGRPRLELVLGAIDFSHPDAVEALTVCSEHMTAGALDLATWPALEEEVQGVLLEFSDCVREHGVLGFPDPVPAFTGIGGPYPLDEIPFDDPDLQAAVRTCEGRLAVAD